MANSKPRNNQRSDRGKNRKAGNAPKLSAEQEKQQLATQLGLKRRTKAFVDEIVNNPSISNTEAYIRTHETNNRLTARKEASKLLSKRSVVLYKDSYLKKARERVATLVDSNNESIALKASESIINRELGTPTQKSENISKTVEVKLDLSGARIGAHYIQPDQQPTLSE